MTFFLPYGLYRSRSECRVVARFSQSRVDTTYAVIINLRVFMKNLLSSFNVKTVHTVIFCFYCATLDFIMV